MCDQLRQFQLNEERYLEILEKLIGVAEKLQNSSQLGKVAQEDLAADIVESYLHKHYQTAGGPLLVDRVAYVEGRSNLIYTYPGSSDNTVSFLGAHMDVVPADNDGWEHPPFTLTKIDDKLYGRGTTDCLGHVALMTELLLQLCEGKLKLKNSVAVVMIANEEDGTVKGIGVDELMKQGRIDFIKKGPVVWTDVADSQPCIGTAGSLTFHLTASGKLFHSGLPQLGINALELAMDGCTELQKRFYQDYPPHPREKEYSYETSSTMKPTKMAMSPSGVNQLPEWVTLTGDIRLVPFYNMKEMIEKLQSHVKDINENIQNLERNDCRGPFSKYVIEDGTRGKLKLDLQIRAGEGIACDLKSPGFTALNKAIDDVVEGGSKPYSLTGSLPLVRELQDHGFDVQLIGFGNMKTYHGKNEYATLSGMKDGLRVCAKFLANLE